jgi:hypothetical protein
MKDTPLSDELGDLLRAERDFPALDPAERGRMLAKLQAVLPLPPMPSSVGSPNGTSGAANGAPPVAPSGPAVVGGASAVKPLLAALLLAIGAAGGAAGHAAFAPRTPAPAVARVPVPITIQVPATLEPSPAEAPTAGSASASASPVAASSAPSRGAASAERPGDARQLKAERLLLEAARTALTRGDHESARRALARHAASFANGQLAEEREVLMVQALRAAGDDDGARRRAAEFDRKFPSSLQRDAIGGTRAEQPVDQASRP